MMNRSNFRRLERVGPEALLSELSTRQYLHPHESLDSALAGVRHELGFCPEAARTAIEWLRLDRSIAVGRLRRSELMQLARSIHRFWRQSLSAGVGQPQSG